MLRQLPSVLAELLSTTHGSSRLSRYLSIYRIFILHFFSTVCLVLSSRPLSAVCACTVRMPRVSFDSLERADAFA